MEPAAKGLLPLSALSRRPRSKLDWKAATVVWIPQRGKTASQTSLWMVQRASGAFRTASSMGRW
eukprot:2720589-Pyramimonas_sp.AAC.1